MVLTQTTVRAWEGNQVVERPVTLNDTASTAVSLETAVISLATWKDVYKRQCDLNMGEAHRCDDKEGYEKAWSAAAPAAASRSARTPTPMAARPDEGVALTSAYYLSKAHDRYVSLTGGTSQPQKVQLSVLPHFVDYNDHYIQDGTRSKLKTYITHNLAYFQVGQMIAVFPESQDLDRTLPGYFWESEFVLGHEYGHHIDFTRHGKVLANAGLAWDPYRPRLRRHGRAAPRPVGRQRPGAGARSP